MIAEAFGRIAAFVACLVGLPIHLLICLIIRLQDRGPAIYRCRRLGREGSVYTMFKYRTMRVGSPPLIRDGFKVTVDKADARVTRIGRLLRCGIDELPQLWNIALGDMNWVGPRPDEHWMLPNYGQACRERLLTKPGITGLAQVLDSRNSPTSMGYAIDIWYNRHRSFVLDLNIILLTPLFILGWRSVAFSLRRRLTTDEEVLRLSAASQEEIADAERAIS